MECSISSSTFQKEAHVFIQGERELHPYPKEERNTLNAFSKVVLYVFLIQITITAISFIDGYAWLRKSSDNFIAFFPGVNLKLSFFIPWWIDLAIPIVAFFFLNDESIERTNEETRRALMMAFAVFLVPIGMLFLFFSSVVPLEVRTSYLASTFFFALVGFIFSIRQKRGTYSTNEAWFTALETVPYLGTVIGIVHGAVYGLVGATLLVFFHCFIAYPILIITPKKLPDYISEESYTSKPPRIHE